jgi:hypothetical protein
MKKPTISSPLDRIRTAASPASGNQKKAANDAESRSTNAEATARCPGPHSRTPGRNSLRFQSKSP